MQQRRELVGFSLNAKGVAAIARRGRSGALFTTTALASATLLYAAPAVAQDRIFTGPGSDWNTGANWNGSDSPNSSGETAVFQNNGAPATVSIAGNTPLAGIRYEAGAPVRTIDISAIATFFGAGINNQSGVTQIIRINGTTAVNTSLQLAGSSDFVGGQTDVHVGTGFFQIAQQANATNVHAIMEGGILTLETSDGTATLGALSGTGTVAAILNNGALATQELTVGGLNLSTTFAGVMTENPNISLSLVKVGTGTLTLTGTSANSGTTTISAGALAIGNGGTTGVLGPGAVINNASLILNRSNNVTVANAISGTGSLIKSGAGATTLTGANSYGGGTTINAGTLLIGSTTALGTGGVTFAGNGTLGTTSSVSASVNNVTIAGGVSATVGAAAGQTLTLNGTLHIANAAGSALHFGSAGMTGTITAGFTTVGQVPNAGSVSIDGGTLRHGASIATLFVNMNGGLTVAAGATYDLDGNFGAGVNLTGGGTITNNGGAAAEFQAQQLATSTFSSF